MIPPMCTVSQDRTLDLHGSDGGTRMSKSLLILGIGALIIGAGVFVLFVLPEIRGGPYGPLLPNGQPSGGPHVLAVAVSSLGMASGLALLGIGLGRWKRPQASPHDGSPEV